MANLFKMAHEMAKTIKAEFPEVDYKFQFALCVKHLRANVSEFKMIELKGSEKQIAWATDIRNQNIKILENEINQIKTRFNNVVMSAKSVELITKLENAINVIKTTHPEAKFWIENKGVANAYIYRLIYK